MGQVADRANSPLRSRLKSVLGVRIRALKVSHLPCRCRVLTHAKAQENPKTYTKPSLWTPHKQEVKAITELQTALPSTPVQNQRAKCRRC